MTSDITGTFVYLLTATGRVRCERRPLYFAESKLENREHVLASHNLKEHHMSMELSLLEEIFPPPVRITGHTF